jgi:hypothetical protein
MQDKQSCEELLETWKTESVEVFNIHLEEHKHGWDDQMKYFTKKCPIQKLRKDQRNQREQLFEDDYIKTTIYFQGLLQKCFKEKRSISFKCLEFELGFDYDYYISSSQVQTLEFIPSDFVGVLSHHDSSTKIHRIFYHGKLSHEETPKISNRFFAYKLDYDGNVNLDTFDLKIMIKENCQLHDDGEVYNGTGFLISKTDLFNTKIK